MNPILNEADWKVHKLLDEADNFSEIQICESHDREIDSTDGCSECCREHERASRFEEFEYLRLQGRGA